MTHYVERCFQSPWSDIKGFWGKRKKPTQTKSKQTNKTQHKIYSKQKTKTNNIPNPHIVFLGTHDFKFLLILSTITKILTCNPALKLLREKLLKDINKEALCNMLSNLKCFNKYSCWTIPCHNKKKKTNMLSA